MYQSAKSNPKEQCERRRELRNNSTSAETALWRYLKNGQIAGYKFRRQHGMGDYILDFYCPALKLDVELDGSVHASEEAVEHDQQRTAFLQENGIEVMRFENNIVWKDPQAIINAIMKFAEEKK